MQDNSRIEAWGWSPHWERILAEHAEAGQAPARVVRQERELYWLETPRGERTGGVSGRFRHGAVRAAEFPAVGDWVAVESADAERCVIQAVLPRRTMLKRKAAGTATEDQVLAANVDTVFVVAGLDQDFNVRRIERYVAMVWDSGALPVVLLNKADLVAELGAYAKEVEQAAPGVAVHGISAATGAGCDALLKYLAPGATLAAVGSSGVGKSTMTNLLLGHREQEVQAVREDDSRGRHTTTRRELFRLPSGALLIDTPGLREVQLSAGAAALDATFEDVQRLAAECRFADCAHTNEPGCAVQRAIASGDLAEERLASFRKLERELQYQHRRTDVRAQLEEQAKWKAIHKEQRRKKEARDQEYRGRF